MFKWFWTLFSLGVPERTSCESYFVQVARNISDVCWNFGQ